MSITLLPDSAPFTDEQKAWLNGFLAGMLGLEEETPGNSAEVVSSQISAEPIEESFPWHDPGLSLEDRMTLAAEKPLERQLMAAMAQLDCGACGYVCQTYAEAIANGSEKSLKLCVPGAKDTTKKLKELLANAETIPATGQSELPSTNGTPQGHTRQNPFPATLLRAETLNKQGSSKVVRHIEIDLTDSGLEYKVGDALGIYPTNCPDLVSQIVGEFSVNPETPVMVDGQLIPFAEALRAHFCLKDITDELIDLLKTVASPNDLNSLGQLIEQDLLDDMDLLDLLHDLPASRPVIQDFIDSLAPLQPRLYSIASSRSAVGNTVHLTVGQVISEKRNRTRKGVASTMFGDRLFTGDQVRVFVHSSSTFGIPADDATPLIMIGPGTGIAPFRAFLQERQARKAPGKNWLFFGDQHAATDFLYEDELQDFVQSGLLSRLDTAFSRDQSEKIYVQQRMLENAQEIFRWLEAGACVAVCGDAKRMAIDVDNALRRIIELEGKQTEEQARQYLKMLTTSGRYQRDVY
ncbi:MAG: sulfite reductase subunit alpha [Planctomycetaceae bacterium]|nr:sulfite reductase subunit alpha [Planctomycetaceae bacterium]